MVWSSRLVSGGRILVSLGVRDGRGLGFFTRCSLGRGKAFSGVGLGMAV